MGTYAIVKALRSYWANPAYPLHRTEIYQLLFPPLSRLRMFVGQTWWRPLVLVGAALMTLMTAEMLCSGPRPNPLRLLTLGFWSICGSFIFGIVTIALLVLSYVWPLVIAVRASRAIARERERRTWDVLLTLPYDRTDLLLGKLAAALRGLNIYADMVLWVQSFLILLIFVLVIGVLTQRADLTLPDMVLAFVLLVLVMVEFAVVRVQDYVLAGLIGAFTSLVAPTRQMSGILALAAAIGMILIRALCTALPLLGISGMFFPNALLVMATGPSSLIAMALPIPLAILVLLVIPLVRELIIRWAFHWLIRHLSEVPAFI